MSNIEIQVDIDPNGATKTGENSLTTEKRRYILLIDRNFSGRIEIHCKDGGIAGVDKIERLQPAGKIYR